MFVHTLRASFSGLILLQILFFLQTSYGKQSAYCDPSACGNILNISYPFRLRDDPQHCGNSNYQLVCENNTTFLDSYSEYKYRVESINYQNYTIRLSDPSVITNNSCSFPQNSLNPSEYPYSLSYPSSCPYYLYCNRPYSFLYFDGNTLLAHPATFLSCPYPVNQSSYIAFDLCVEKDSISRHKYVKLGHLNASEVRDQCSIDLVVMATIPFGEYNNISLERIHRSLLYGFEVSWLRGACDVSCTEYSVCRWDGKAPVCSSDAAWIVKLYRAYPELEELFWAILYFGLLIVFITGIKIVIGWPIFMGLLVYKLRRRHLSMFDVIEGFLQSHNHLSPIRYSYSNIKKMTGSFREKLGQGGYGSVYKGKLRSGHDVAVKKLIIKSGSNGQDFMNEVSTIGRIHHVNVIRLVGYCAERSKRALIYDFMPNGSLDKCILGQESTSMLSWEKKFDIAVGVARGIEYLHRGCDIQILHFDIKPHNILLDENFTPKISDFGLA